MISGHTRIQSKRRPIELRVIQWQFFREFTYMSSFFFTNFRNSILDSRFFIINRNDNTDHGLPPCIKERLCMAPKGSSLDSLQQHS